MVLPVARALSSLGSCSLVAACQTHRSKFSDEILFDGLAGVAKSVSLFLPAEIPLTCAIFLDCFQTGDGYPSRGSESNWGDRKCHCIV